MVSPFFARNHGQSKNEKESNDRGNFVHGGICCPDTKRAWGELPPAACVQVMQTAGGYG